MIGNIQEIRSRRRLQYLCRDLVHKALRGFLKWETLSSCKCKSRSGGMIYLVVSTDKPAWFVTQECGNVWGCPICSPRKLYKKREKMKRLLAKAKKLGYSLAMVTYTHPHSLDQSFEDLVEWQNSARSNMKSGSKFQKIKAAVGYVGDVAVNHVLWGEKHGLHYHSHEVWIIKNTGALQELHAVISRYWVHEWEKNGIELSEKQKSYMLLNGIDIIPIRSDVDPHQIANYLCRDDFSPKKKSHPNEKLYNPFELLRSNVSNREELFREYLAATGGKSRVTFSRGLEKSLEVGFAKGWSKDEADEDEEISLQKFPSIDKEENSVILCDTGEEAGGDDILSEECQYMGEDDDSGDYVVIKPEDIKVDVTKADDNPTVPMAEGKISSSDECQDVAEVTGNDAKSRWIPINMGQFYRICHCGDAMAKVLDYAEDLAWILDLT